MGPFRYWGCRRHPTIGHLNVAPRCPPERWGASFPGASTMHFTPAGQVGCNPWTVVFTHLSGGDLRMAVDPESSVDYESEFEVRMTRQG